MGKDNTKLSYPSKIVDGWQYPNFNTTSFKVMEYVCNNKGLLL